MQEYPGRFIVLEGADGSGKTTQFSLLAERLRAVGYDVEIFEFPRYNKESSHFVRSYLQGHYGPAAKVGPYTASVFYAVDRYEAAPEIRRALKAGKIVISDRYVGSNMGHQGAKFSDETEQRGFFVWDDSFEFELMGIPRPDINLYLRVPPPISARLLKERSKKTGVKPDEHEADKDHLAKATATYDVLCKLFPRDYVSIECADGDKLLSIAAINNKIWENLQLVLPKPAHKGKATVVKLDALTTPIAEKPEVAAPRAPKKSLAAYETKIPLLSYLKLIQQPELQLQVHKLPVFNGQPDSYYTPLDLSKSLTGKYREIMKEIGKLQQQIAAKAPSAAWLTTPLAAYGKVSVPGSTELAKFMNGLEKNGGKPGQTPTQRLAQEELSGTIAPKDDELRLLDFWPRSEFTLLADGLYPYAGLGRQEILDGIDRWSYERKEKALQTVLLSPDSQVLEELRYRWDGLSSAAAVIVAVREGVVSDIKLQTPSVRFGYEVPESIEKANLEDEFMRCFDLSLELFSALQAADHETAEPFAVLLGHKLRWQFSSGIAALNNPARSSNHLLAAINEKVGEIHPLTAKAIHEQTKESKPAVKTTQRAQTGRKRRRR